MVHMNKADKATPAEIGWEGSLDSLAQVIYTSGSTGTPKGRGGGVDGVGWAGGEVGSGSRS